MFIHGVRYTVLLTCIAVAFIATGLLYYFKPLPHHISYLALGDSYTVGSHIGYYDNYPMQLVSYLQRQHIDAGEPRFIAHAGWTSGDLCKAIKRKKLSDTFTFVTLQIGANNQFRGLDLNSYRQQFGELLTKAIAYTGGHTERVFVLSVPDWSASPFAEGWIRQRIAEQVAVYNSIIKEMTLGNNCNYVDIADALKPHALDHEYFLKDYIHPSAKGYAVWAAKLAPEVARSLK